MLGHLGLAAAAAGQPQRGLALLEQELRSARTAGDHLAEKSTLAHLGLPHSRLHDPPPALALFAQALAIARDVGDWQHEAELLSRLARCRAADVPMTNYGVTIAYTLGILERALGPFPAALDAYHSRAGRKGEARPPAGA
ncbi:MAG TPA: tetratricopeptide repeat protein [Gemmataceae bacterium]|nr:tetratricopeptide repeat protein [Gemmataceae bacterium]